MKNNFNKGNVLTGCASSLVLFSALAASQSVLAHGFVEVPPSRALLCQQGVNLNCGGAQYEPQSTGETFKVFPNGVGVAPLQGPIDDKIASDCKYNFAVLDAQSATRLHQTEISDRNISFQWNYYAAHPAINLEYFITRDRWN